MVTDRRALLELFHKPLFKFGVQCGRAPTPTGSYPALAILVGTVVLGTRSRYQE